MGLRNRGKMAFISGRQENNSQILRGTGEQRQYFGTGNIRKQIFDFWETGEQSNLWEGLIKFNDLQPFKTVQFQ